MCIAMLMISALVVANEAGLERMNPWVGIVTALVLMWGAFKLIDTLPDKEKEK